MVLRQRHGPHLGPRYETHERELGPFEVILHDHPTVAEAIVEQHVAQGRFGLLHATGDHHPFSGREAVVFEHRRQRPRSHILHRRTVVVERTVSGRRDAVAHHELLGELLARFDTGRRRRRSEDTEPPKTELVHDPGLQGHLRPDHRQVYALILCERQQSLHVGILERHILRHLRYPGIARRTIYLFHFRRTTQRIHDRMATAAAPYNKYFHLSLFSFGSIKRRPPETTTVSPGGPTGVNV